MLSDSQIALLKSIPHDDTFALEQLDHINWSDLSPLCKHKLIEIIEGAFSLTERGIGYLLAVEHYQEKAECTEAIEV